MSIRFSVIIPMYNISNYIERCIYSVLNQTYINYEIIVVNDGSTDDSLTKIQKYSSVIKIINKENGGLSSARNVGIDNAKGEYCVFIDGDDYVSRNYLELFDKAIVASNNCDIIMSGYTRVNKNKEKTYLYKNMNGFVEYKEILLKMIGPSPRDEDRYKMTAWGKAYQTLFLKQNQIKFKSEREFVSEDLVFHIDILKFKPSVYFTHNAGYHYVNNDYQSLTKVFKKDRIEKENKLRDYLLEIARQEKFVEQELFRIHYNYLTRYEFVIRNITEKTRVKKELLSLNDVKKSIAFCQLFEISFKKKIRIFYLKRKNIKILKLISIIKR